MAELVLVVEGHGDVDALPSLTGKIGGWLGQPIYTSKPIRSGGWGRLKRPGGLEKMVRLAASRPGCTRVVAIVDLDDGCPLQERGEIEDRIQSLRDELGIQIEVCFCIREFEAWILAVLDEVAIRCPEYGWIVPEPPQNWQTIRDAKGELQARMAEPYGEATDQGNLARAIPPDLLYQRDRSFRRFVKAVSALGYDVLAAA